MHNKTNMAKYMYMRNEMRDCHQESTSSKEFTKEIICGILSISCMVGIVVFSAGIFRMLTP